MKYLFLIGSFFIMANSFAQREKIALQGIVIDKITKQPLEFVSVELQYAKDSSLRKGMLTDKLGKFVFTNLNSGKYLLTLSYIGYDVTKTREVFIAEGQQAVNLGNLELENTATKLNEVVVSSTKKTLNASIDRKVYNVDKDIMSKSGAASDILKNVPSVEVDIDGGVSLRGSSNVMILINGKVSPLMGKSRAEVLQSLPANSIERIEVITNPSARFRPDGTSGIINIVLKKNARLGWNGSLTANAGNSDRYNGSLLLNYNPGKLNLFGSLSLRKDHRLRSNIIDRTYFDTTGKTMSFYNEVNNSKMRPVSTVANLGVTYNLNDKNSLGISGSYYDRSLTKHDVVNKFTFNPQQVLIENYDRLRLDPEVETQTNYTAFYEHKFKKEDHEIRMEFNKSKSDETEDNQYKNIYKLPALPSYVERTLIKQKANENQLTLDYTLPINENSKLEAGYDGSFNKMDFDFFGSFYDTLQNKFIEDAVKTNRFLYEEKIQALYTTYEQRFKKFGFQFGLRGEQVNIKGNLVTIDSFIKNDYFKVYPTLHLSYALKSKNEIQLNYSRRINRPDADELNPFPEYRDPRNLQAGNPKLLPEIINSVEFGYKWEHKNFSFVPSLYYRYRTNGFTEVIRPINDSTLLTTSENLAKDQAAGMELIFSATTGKFTSNLSSNIFYNQIDASNLGYSKSKAIVAFSANLNSSYSLSKNNMVQFSTNFRSARLTPQGKVFARYISNIGMRQDFLKKKATVTITVSDLFASGKDKREFNSVYFNQYSVGRRDTRIIYIGASYRFGKVKKAPKDEKIQFDSGG